MIRRFLVACVLVLTVAAPARAQEGIDATKVTFPSGPTVTAGSGAPTASEPNGSFYHRTNGQWYVRTGGLWVTPVDTNGAITTLGTVSSLTAFGVHLLPTLSDTFDLGSPFKLWRKSYISEMSAVLFSKETQQLYGGWLSVSKNAGVLAASVSSGDTTVDFGTAMTTNQFVLIRAADNNTGAITSEFFKVGTLVSGTRYNVTRNLSGLGAKDWATGTPFMVRGVAGDGWLELNAFDTPRLSLFTQGSLYNNSTENIRIGHLTGMPNSASGIGIYLGDATNYLYANGSVFTVKANALTVDSSGVQVPEAGGSASKTGGTFRFTRLGTSFDKTSADIDGLAAYRVLGGVIGDTQNDSYLELRNKMVGDAGTADNGNAHVLLSATGWDDVTHASTTTVSLEGVSANSSSVTAGWTLTGALTTSSTIAERGRTFNMGDENQVTYSGSNFTASTGTWTVQSGDQTTFSWSLTGKTMTVWFYLDSTSVSATPAELQIAIPNGAVAARTAGNGFQAIDNGATGVMGWARVVPGDTIIRLQSSIAGAGWATSTNNTFARGQLTFPIQ